MPEALTESFCERCGTRYEFKAPTRLNPLRKTRGLVSGLRNYIMSQDALSDAVGDAIRSEEESLAARQLEAFHESFNFCIDCRQYTCVNCWNHEAGRCRACAPIPGTDDLLERFEASFQAQHPERVQASNAIAEPSTDGASLEREAWPETDLAVAATNGHADVAWPEAELIGRRAASEEPTETEAFETDTFETGAFETAATDEAEPAVKPEPALEPESIETAAFEREPIETMAFDSEQRSVEPFVPESPQPAVEAEIEWEQPTADADAPRVQSWEADAPFELLPPEFYLESAREPELVAEAEPEPDVVAEVLAEAEPEVAAQPEHELVAEAEPEPDVVAEVLAEAEPEVAAEPEHELVAEAEPEPEPQTAPKAEPESELEPLPDTPQRTLRPISDTILRLPAREPIVDEPRIAAEADDPAVAARRAQLDLLGLGDPGEGPVTPAPRTVLPYRSSGASALPTSQVAAGGATGSGSFWDASAREVASALSQIGVQNCGHCGLSLSASARFCRRCGTRQARSA